MTAILDAVPDIRSYYRHTRWDYRRVWAGPNRAVHFGYYDAFAHKHLDALDNMNRVMAEMVGISSADHVLDAGCGMGNSCFWLAQKRGARVTGVSIVPEQIVDCEQRLLQVGTPGVAFQCADYLQLPFADGQFDVVWACESLCHAPNKLLFYQEAYRVLRPGGRLIIAEYLRSARPLEQAMEQQLQRWLAPWAIPDIDREEEHRQHAKKSGFSSFTVQDVTPQVQVSLRNLHQICRQWLPIGKILRFLHIINDIRLNNVRASIAQYEALQVGAWQDGMMLAITSPAHEVVE
ncbi:MAG: methyltransferase domain-containing protein [Lewinellaceae bacterium]|nr:methyltransferase domain-containing protein [Lewinellaceae bacterium]